MSDLADLFRLGWAIIKIKWRTRRLRRLNRKQERLSRNHGVTNASYR